MSRLLKFCLPLKVYLIQKVTDYEKGNICVQMSTIYTGTRIRHKNCNEILLELFPLASLSVETDLPRQTLERDWLVTFWLLSDFTIIKKFRHFAKYFRLIVSYLDCDQIGSFIAIWATFYGRGDNFFQNRQNFGDFWAIFKED